MFIKLSAIFCSIDFIFSLNRSDDAAIPICPVVLFTTTGVVARPAIIPATPAIKVAFCCPVPVPEVPIRIVLDSIDVPALAII